MDRSVRGVRPQRQVLLAGVWSLALFAFAAQGDAWAAANRVEERFREATALVQAGDAAKGVAIYRELAAAGSESASLYWNWAQAASTRGALGEALWALLRARELEPGDAALGREIERLRQLANLDAAELSPAPLAALSRTSRRLHLDLAAVLLLMASI
ncbi:MAG: hypothetical protein V1750_08840, partial [Acidobacteriota bacterium]